MAEWVWQGCHTLLLYVKIILNCYLVMMICIRLGAAEAGDLRYL